MAKTKAAKSKKAPKAKKTNGAATEKKAAAPFKDYGNGVKFREGTSSQVISDGIMGKKAGITISEGVKLMKEAKIESDNFEGRVHRVGGQLVVAKLAKREKRNDEVVYCPA